MMMIVMMVIMIDNRSFLVSITEAHLEFARSAEHQSTAHSGCSFLIIARKMKKKSRNL
jgi:hypothetical protein